MTVLVLVRTEKCIREPTLGFGHSRDVSFRGRVRREL